jgi:hypothetical protein
VAVSCENGNIFWCSVDKIHSLSNDNRLHQYVLVTLDVMNPLQVLTSNFSDDLKID